MESNTSTSLPPINATTAFNLTTIAVNTTDVVFDNSTHAIDSDNNIPKEHTVPSSGVLTYTLIFLGVLILIALVIALGIFLIKKSRLDKLRHHLMPLYNFDPAEEGEDWESELLEEGLDHRLTSKMKKSYHTDEPKLTFNSGI